jgi:hypothetical protein
VTILHVNQSSMKLVVMNSMELYSVMDSPEFEEPTALHDLLKDLSFSNLISCHTIVFLKEGMYMRKALELSLYQKKIPFFCHGF